MQALITRGAIPSAYYASEILTKALEKGHYGLALLCLEKMPQLRLNLKMAAPDEMSGSLLANPYS